MNLIPGLTLRCSEEAEIEGIDESEIGEFAYDFVEKERDYVHGPLSVEGVAHFKDVESEPKKGEEV